MHRRFLLRRMVSLALVLLAMMALRVHAQAVPAGGIGGAGMTPEQQQALQDQVQQMQAIRDQVMVNMQNAGVDPQAFMQDLQQQMQDGSMDMAGLQQQLVQKGFMTQQMSDQLSGSMNALQGTVRNVSLNNMKLRLNASDEEWVVLLPKIQKIMDLMADVNPPTPVTVARGGGGAGGGGGLGGLAMAPQVPNTEVGKAFRNLQEVLKDPNASEDRIAARLVAWRELHDKARMLLELAQGDLVSILTLRQEAILMGLGLL